ncbi:ETC complex I subunit [Rhodospirillales bacterium]|nr:ETC complex I subunit [Rhodospirillales bacterium]
MKAKIYQPARTAMQSGYANVQHWIVEYEPEEAKKVDTLMGWAGSGDMRGQLRLKFETKEEAIAYAERNALSYNLAEPNIRRVIPKSYSDNFKYTKVE